MPNATKDFSEYPYKFRDYVYKQHESCSEGNQADHRPTYPDELDDITASCIKMYERGLAVIETMADAEHAQCQALFELEHGELAQFKCDTYVQTSFTGTGTVLVPTYVTKLGAARFLQPFFTTPALVESTG